MDIPDNITNIFRDWLSVLQLIVVISSVITLIVTLVHNAKKPNEEQNERIASLEAWREKVNRRLEEEDDHFKSIDEGNRVTQEALLALMGHAINGNDIEKLKQAKYKLEEYLIKK